MMNMTFAQFLRIQTAAGGVGASQVQFIRAAHGVLSKLGKSPEYRTQRHAWLRQGLYWHERF